MDKTALAETRKWLQAQLDTCVDFWLQHGMDKVNGGVYTCLDRTGRVYSTDKSVWMQGRCGWIFAYLCRVYGVKQEWLQASKSCLDFMEAHCINRGADDRMYFQVTAEGKPLRQRRYCFSEGFYAIANAEYYGVTGEEIYLQRARKAYSMIYKLNNGLMKDPTGLGPKGIPETRSGRGLANPMIFLNITSVLRRVDPAHTEEYDKYSAQCAEQIFKYHVKKDLNCTLENVGLNGEVWTDVTEGRIVNPGHDIECSWFLMEYANYLGGQAGAKLHEDAQWVFNTAINAGWDKEYGGLLYFIDALGNPPEAY
ncbi:MAG: AGE family epimerase/isomerase, partial [Oscillospiraceae bacterium]|nr:AGE family epimerase/isomerase [Oscillospiraceae bacterium]